MNVINLLKQLWFYKDLRRRVVIILSLLLFFRLLANIPLPDIDRQAISNFFAGKSFLGLFDLFAGGALSNFSLVMLGLGPYITATIILQILTFVYPRLKEMYYEEGEFGRAKFMQYARIMTIPLAFLQALGWINFLIANNIVPFNGYLNLVKDALLVTVGTMILMWIGELITEQKLGNGISLIIFSGIVSHMPQVLYKSYLDISSFNAAIIQSYLLFLALALLVIIGIIFINEAEKRVPLTFAKRVRGNRIYGGANTYLPVRLSQAGVIPIIFAIAILLFPQTIFQLLAKSNWGFISAILSNINSFLSNQLFFGFLYFILVFAFTYFYTSVAFNPDEIAKNLQHSGAFIPGVRPGKETQKYFKDTVFRLTFFGGLFLGFIAVLPYIFQYITGVQYLSIGGTSILIIVSVAIETVKQIRSEVSLRRYET